MHQRVECAVYTQSPHKAQRPDPDEEEKEAIEKIAVDTKFDCPIAVITSPTPAALCNEGGHRSQPSPQTNYRGKTEEASSKGYEKEKC